MSFGVTRTPAVDFEKFQEEHGFGEKIDFEELLPEKQSIVWDGTDVLDVGISQSNGDVQYLIES